VNPPGAGTDQVSAIPAGAFCRLRIIPVAVIDNVGDAAPLTEALPPAALAALRSCSGCRLRSPRWP
jgi:hypothetical protein